MNGGGKGARVKVARGSLITASDEVVSELLDNVGVLAGLDALVVDTDDDTLVGLDGGNTGGSLLSVDGAVVGADGEVAGSSEGESGGDDRVRGGEASGKGLSLGSRDGEGG